MTQNTQFKIEPIIGLEVHVQLATKTKLWCACPAGSGGSPNTRVCPVCLGLPGALPVLNERAVEYAVLAGLALNCMIAERAKWDRKSYYYPDMPKNYQISQYGMPLCENGYIELKSDHKIHKIRIRRAHLEEDAGKSIHDSADFTAIDLNRAGTPLLEIVTEPDLRSAEQAREFAIQLQRLVRYLGVSEANMQKGQLRFEPNVNLRIVSKDDQYRTPLVEVKNLNSFRSLHAAISYEIRRQFDQWRQNGIVAGVGNKSNRGWDDVREVTVPQREKEESHDYRYFADPDLLPLTPDPAWVASLREHLPELPIPRTERFVSEYKLRAKDAPALVECRATADLLDHAAEAGGDKPTLGKHFLSFWSKLANERRTTIAGLGVSPRHMAELANLFKQGRINATSAAQIAEAMARRADELLARRARARAPAVGVQRPSQENCVIEFAPVESADLEPARLAKELGLIQSSNAEQMAGWVDEVLAANQKAVHDALVDPQKTRAARSFLVGQVMKLSGGKAAPRIVSQLIEHRLAAAVQRSE